MIRSLLRTASLVAVAFVFVTSLAARPAEAGVSETVLALAGPLAEQFGVPASAVTTLLEGGVSLESVTQLLLVSQSAETGLDEVTSAYRKYEGDITKTANDYKVAASAYSMENVNSAIDDAKQQLTADATKKVTEGTTKALDDALGGFRR